MSNDDYLFSEEERMNLDLLVKFEEEKRIEEEKKKLTEEKEKLTEEKEKLTEEKEKLMEEKEKLTEEKEKIIEEAQKLGLQEGIKEMIISMIKNKIDYNQISKITNKSIEEIKKIME